MGIDLDAILLAHFHFYIPHVDGDWLFILLQSEDQLEEVQSTPIKTDKSRYEVYEDWFKKHIDQKEICSCDVAKVSSFKMDSFERKNLREDGKKNWKALKRPVIEIKSILTIKKPEEFPNLLLKGVGRHQAFGFGMLKIIPTSSV